jgi:hypothetical protein
MWIVVSIVALTGLIYFWHGLNAVWGGAILGLMVELFATVDHLSSGSGFQYEMVGRPVVIAILIGLAVEVLWRIARRSPR